MRPLGSVHPAPRAHGPDRPRPYGGPMHRSRVGPLLALVLVLQPLAACGTDGTTTENASGRRAAGLRGRPGVPRPLARPQRDRGHPGSPGRDGEAVLRVRWESLAAGVATTSRRPPPTSATRRSTHRRRRSGPSARWSTRCSPSTWRASSRRCGRAAGSSRPRTRRRRNRRRCARPTARSARCTGAADKAIAPAVVQLANTDPTESTTITRRMRDLALLAQTSDVWQVCKSALRTIHAYEHLHAGRQEVRLTCRRLVVC